MKLVDHCIICKTKDRRRLIELGWNGGMSATAISDVLGGTPTGRTILKHLKEHTEGGNHREIDVEPELPARERVARLQAMQLDEIERRVELAKAKADEMNAWRDGKKDSEGNPLALVDWSDFTDILGKDMQAAINSIQKAQGLTDKREKAQGDLKLGLFEAMSNAGMAPKAISGGDIKVLPAGDDD
jgi:hypothetical protein